MLPKPIGLLDEQALDATLAPHVFGNGEHDLFFHTTGRLEVFDAAIVQLIEVIFVFIEDDKFFRERAMLQCIVPLAIS